MEWSNDLVLEFLDLYEKEPMIWNPRHRLHKDKNEVHDAWRRIQDQLSVKYSVTDLKKKKDSLMASFRVCCNKVKRRAKNGTDDTYIPNWFAYAKMASFLGSKQGSKETPSSEEIGVDVMKEIIESENQESDEGRFPGPTFMSDQVGSEDAMPAFISPMVSYKFPVLKKRKLSEEEEMRQNINAALQMISKEKPVKEHDECDLFGQLLAAKLRKMDEHTKNVTMNRIDNLVFQMSINSYPHSPIPRPNPLSPNTDSID